MNDAYFVAATGMSAQQLQLDAISNNLVNVFTAGYKKQRVSFQELVAQTAPGADAAVPGSTGGPAEALRGAGVLARPGDKLFSPGDVRKTDSAMDVAIRGNGFLEVILPDGSSGYSRGGTLTVNKDGLLADANGHPFKAQITVRADAAALSIQPDGKVSARLGGDAKATELGQLDLVDFSQPGGLVSLGDGVYQATERSGDPIAVTAGVDGSGTLAQGMLELSNVDMVEELSSLMLAQRSYGLSVKVLQAADEMAAMANNLRR